MTQRVDGSRGASRRAFLRQGTLVLLGAGMSLRGSADLLADEPAASPRVRVGMLTDLHYADKPPAGTRYYRETLTKLEEAAQQFEQQRPQLVIELGDLIDAADTVETELSYLKRIQRSMAALPGQKHYVLGNHCVETLTKQEFLGEVGQERSYYSFDAGGVHFVVLDACFRSDFVPYGRKNSRWDDANLPAAELDWLRSDLEAAAGPVIVLIHQRLDVQNHYGVKNAADARKLLEQSGKVLAVFQGHSHKNDYREIEGIHYVTLAAMIEGSGPENNSYSVLDVFDGGALRLTGFRRQANYAWS